MPGWNPKANDIFLEALEFNSPADQRAFIERSCGDDADLREQVESLVAASQKAGSFLENPAVPATLLLATIDQPITEKPGTQIGPYKLLQQIGEGGMGVVYMAEQKEPVKRRVALKIIKPGMDTRQVIARFEAERQALAMMDHPNIAKVLDAGATESGRPYFVMELVNGLPVTKYCDEQHLTPKERLELFVPICQAVQHAHQKGIIHRDLKPSNILVALYDGRPVPKVIDFGVAKATSQTLTEKTMFTELGQVVGTVEYMSPEQAERNQLDIDTRSDIYSLGVVIYELLTGDTPFDRARLRSAAFDEMLRIIREEEPSKPSTKVSSSQSLPSIAANRHIEPAKLGNMIRGELDWIVMKALEKDRARRYETASKFAEDVQHYLNDEAVVACPPSASYRFHKFARRNKGRLVTATLLTAALLVTVGVAGWAVRDQAAQRAEFARSESERQQRVTTQVELLLTEVDRLVLEERWDEALATAQRAEAALAGGESDEAVKSSVTAAQQELRFVARLTEIRMESSAWKEDAFDNAGTLQSYGQAFREFGVDVETLPVSTAVEQLKQHPRIISPIAAALDHFAQLMRYMENDDTLWRSLVGIAHGIDPDPLRDELRALMGPKVTPEFQATLRELAESLDMRTFRPSTAVNLADALARAKLAALQEQILRQAQQAFPNDYWINHELGWLQHEQRQFEDAVRFFSVAVGIDPKNTAALTNLGLALEAQGNLDEAIACYRKAIELDSEHWRAHYNLGNALSDQGNLDEAIAEYLVASQLIPNRSTAHYNLASAYVGQGQLDDAIASYRKAIELDPKNALFHSDLGAALVDQERLDEAGAECRLAIQLDPKLYYPHLNLGLVFEVQGRLDEAIAEYRVAIILDPNNVNAHVNLGNALVRQGQLDEAVGEYRTAIGLEPNAKHKVIGSVVDLAKSQLALGNQQAHHAACQSLIALFPSPAQRKTADWGHLGQLLYLAGQYAEAKIALEKVIELRMDEGPALQGGPRWWYLAMTLASLCDDERAREIFEQLCKQADQTNPLPDAIMRLRANAAEVLGIEIDND